MNPRSTPAARRLPLLVLLAVALVGAACSSTAQKAKDARGKTAAGVEATAPGVDGTVPVDGEGAADAATSVVGKKGSKAKGAVGTKTGSGGGGTSTGGGGGTGGTGGGGSTGGWTLGQGVTATEIKIGLQVNAPIDYTAFGGTGSSGDDQKASKAVVDYLNTKGGIAGRRIVPVYHITDTQNGTYAAQAEAACTDFTEDKKVFAAVSTSNAGEPAECYFRHGMPYISHKKEWHGLETMQKYAGSLYVPGRMSATRWTGAWVDGLAAQGYFEPGAKVGLLRVNRADVDVTTAKVLKPRLAAHGVTVADEVTITPPGSTPEIGDAAAEIGSAVLRFRTNNITHVLLYETAGGGPLLFMPPAESQGYRPRYGLSSGNLLQFSKAAVPEAQLLRSVGVGWIPTEDVAEPEDPGGNANATLCRQIWAQAGLAAPARSTALANALAYCDALFFLKAALDTTTNLTPGGLQAAVERLGDGYNSPLTFGTKFGPGRHDGGAVVRNIAFVEACHCFRYTGGPRPAP